MLRYANLLSVLLARVAGYSNDLVALPGFCHEPSSKDDAARTNPGLSIEWDRQRKCVYAEWEGFANGAEFRASLIRTLDAIRDRNAALLVSDNRRIEVVTHHGLCNIATEEILSLIGHTVFVTRTLTTESEATEWVAEA